ncbi:MAG: hypothetical protein KA144_15610 [Xanthomonadaceae bacterium]|nr:hypothetical protein [Xanthomonadaceae bacterium]MCC7248277.1 hypothetical protein [Lysobacter sp.]
MTQVILGPNETVKFQAVCKTKPAEDLLYGLYLLTLTTKRVFAEDNLGTLIFNYYLKDIDRGEIDKTFWKGTRVKLVLRNGNNHLFSVVKDLVTEDPAGSQRLINMINQVILVLRNQPAQPSVE